MPQLTQCTLIRVFASCLRGLKMQYQVFILDFIIMLFAMLLVGVAYYIQTQIIVTLIKFSSELILLRQDWNAISTSAYQLTSYINQKQYSYLFQLNHLTYFFQFYENNKNSYSVQNPQLYKCMDATQEFKNDISKQYSSFCVNYKDTSFEGKIIETFTDSIEQINQFTISIEATEDSFITITDLSGNYWANYPYPSNSNISPNQQLWYANYFEQQRAQPTRQYFFSPTFEIYTNKLQFMPISCTIKGNQQEHIGILEQAIQITDLYISNVPFNLMIVNQEGYMLVVGIEGADYHSDNVNFDEVNLTGFNQTDWNVIQQFTKDNSKHPSCDGFSQSFCLFNSYFQKQVVINATFFEDYNFTLLLFSNVTFSLKLEREFNSIIVSLKSLIGLYQYIQLLSGVFLIFSSLLAIRCIFRPLTEFMVSIQFAIKQAGNNLNVEIFKMLNARKNLHQKDQGNFSTLRQCFFQFQKHLNKQQQNKNTVCVLMESLMYPTKIETLITLSSLKVQLHNNLSNIFTKDHLLETIKFSLKKCIDRTEEQQYQQN